MEKSEFDAFLKENVSLKEAAFKCAEDFLGKNASEKAKENVAVIFMLGATWQVSQFVQDIENKRSKAAPTMV